MLSVDYRTSPPAVNALVLAIGALAAALIFLAVWAGTMSRSTCPACWNRIEPSFNLCPRCGVRLR